MADNSSHNANSEHDGESKFGAHRETRRDDFDSDGESIASDTDSFVHVGSVGSNSDSEWEKVSFHGDDSDSDNFMMMAEIDLRYTLVIHLRKKQF